MVELRNVSKYFGDMVAVENLSLTTRQAGIFGLIGPNGAGKTTTIRMIMNILSVDSGEIRFDGHVIREQDKQRIGYVPEERGLYRKVTVEEMLLYLARLKGTPAARARREIARWLERFGLGHVRSHKIETLSKGMSQKIQFIAAVLHDPDILFFDEPFSGLDPVSADELRGLIDELGRQGKTILLSTHIMEHAERICSDILLMNKGREVASGSMQELKQRYGRRSVIVEFDGDGSWLGSLPQVRKVQAYPRYTELALAEQADTDALLRELAARVSVQRFEITTPSLHRIFVDAMEGEQDA